jgi:hypothetical protein
MADSETLGSASAKNEYIRELETLLDDLAKQVKLLEK